MEFTFVHANLNVLDLDRSTAFYQEALGLTVVKKKLAQDGSFILAFLQDNTANAQVELTWLNGRTEPYELGDNESHLAFTVDDFDAAYNLHQKMGCICYENKGMGLYFIEDPDGYWIEILPLKKAI